MTRCPHCKKLTHSEDLNVYFDIKDYDKIEELTTHEKWVPFWEYSKHNYNSPEIGYLRVLDINIHFISMNKEHIKEE